MGGGLAGGRPSRAPRAGGARRCEMAAARRPPIMAAGARRGSRAQRPLPAAAPGLCAAVGRGRARGGRARSGGAASAWSPVTACVGGRRGGGRVGSWKGRRVPAGPRPDPGTPAEDGGLGTRSPPGRLSAASVVCQAVGTVGICDLGGAVERSISWGSPVVLAVRARTPALRCGRCVHECFTPLAPRRGGAGVSPELSRRARAQHRGVTSSCSGEYLL